MADISSFFSDRNTVNSVSENDFSQTTDYLEIVKAFARLTYQSIYIIDYEKKAFEYVSDNPLFLCGLTPQEVQELGYAFYFRNVQEDDLNLLIKVNEVGFEFFEKININDRKNYTISYDFNITNQKKNNILINHKLTPIFLTEEGKIWKAMCIVSLSPNHNSGNIRISKQNSNEIWQYHLQDNKWIIEERIKLSDRETEILRFYARGLTITEIAEKIFVSADTVKFHRRKLFEKIGIQNITEALAYAKNNKLI